VTPNPLGDHDRPSVAIDLALLTIVERQLRVLVMRLADGSFGLPGGFVHIHESLEATVERVLRDKARLPGAFVEQLYTFGAPDRDPRGRVISVAHYALVPAERLAEALAQDEGLTLALIEDGRVKWPDGAVAGLAYDHDEILRTAVERLRGKLDYSAVGLELLPELFTLRQLQEVHEAILGAQLAKPAFRRRMLDRGYLKPTGRLETGGAFRPAELYRRA